MCLDTDSVKCEERLSESKKNLCLKIWSQNLKSQKNSPREKIVQSKNFNIFANSNPTDKFQTSLKSLWNFESNETLKNQKLEKQFETCHSFSDFYRDFLNIEGVQFDKKNKLLISEPLSHLLWEIVTKMLWTLAILN